MNQGLTNKVTIVTGGSSGIGRAAALALAQAGARLSIADVDEAGGRETAQLIREGGGEAIFIKTDVSHAADVKQMVSHTVAHYNQLDCAFNNAGIHREGGPIVDCPEELWDRTINVNLKGIYLCMKYQIPQMLKTGGGAIVNTSSGVGLTGTTGGPAYVASKHGIIGLTKATALDYGKQGIRVNAVCPGTIKTPMYDRRIGDDPQTDERLAAESALGRLGTPQDVAEAVVWLCSDAASFVTGHALVVDGGDII